MENRFVFAKGQWEIALFLLVANGKSVVFAMGQWKRIAVGGVGPAGQAGRPSQKQKLLATHKHKTIFHWPLTKTKLFFHWPPAKTKRFSVGHWQKQSYFPLAHGKNRTIFHWPMGFL